MPVSYLLCLLIVNDPCWGTSLEGRGDEKIRGALMSTKMMRVSAASASEEVF